MIALLFALACGPTFDEPADIPYDRFACGHCGMIVGDPRFAAQLTTNEGDRLYFDDPVCVFQQIVEHGPHLRHVWFQDSQNGGWLDWQQVAFVEAKGAPMDGGLAAVPVGTEGAISFSEASSRAIGGAK